MPGVCLNWGNARFHLNWHLPQLEPVDVIILNGYQNSVTQHILNVYAHKIPCIFWGEKIIAESIGLKGRLQKLFSKGLDNCRAIAAIGCKAEQDYRHRFPDKPIVNIPYYCDLTHFNQPKQQDPKAPFTILFCGQMIARKGLDLLLQAFHQLLNRGYSAKLLLVGREAELPDMLQSIPEHVQQHIEFAGFQAPEDLPHFFHRADLFVLPSRYDGWGVVINQALGAGLPIICSDAVGAATDLIDQGVNGFTFTSGSIEELSTVLKQFLDSPSFIKTASQASAFKSEQWSPNVGAKRWLGLLKMVTA